MYCLEASYCLITATYDSNSPSDVVVVGFNTADSTFASISFIAPWNQEAQDNGKNYEDQFASLAYFGNQTYAAVWQTKYFDNDDTTIVLSLSFNRGMNWTFPAQVNQPALMEYSRNARIAKVGSDAFLVTYEQIPNPRVVGGVSVYDTNFPYVLYRISDAVAFTTNVTSVSKGYLGGIKRNYTYSGDGSYAPWIAFDGEATSLAFFSYNSTIDVSDVFASTTFGLPECYPTTSLITPSSLTCTSTSAVGSSGSLIILVTSPTVYLGELSLKGSDNLNVSSSLSVSGNLVLSGSSAMTLAAGSSTSINGTSPLPTLTYWTSTFLCASITRFTTFSDLAVSDP